MATGRSSYFHALSSARTLGSGAISEQNEESRVGVGEANEANEGE